MWTTRLFLILVQVKLWWLGHIQQVYSSCYISLTDQLCTYVVRATLCCWICVYVCVHSPVQGTAAWDAPGFLWERPTFQFWWIRHLLAVRLQFRKGGFREAKQKPGVLRGTDVEEEEGGGRRWRQEGNSRVFVGRLYIMHKWTISSAESSPRPADHQRPRLSPRPPLCLALSHFEISIPPASALCYHGKAKQLAICKQNHVCLL